METADLTITVKVDTSTAARDLQEFRRYALKVLEEIKAAYAALEQAGPEGVPGAKRRA